MHSRIGCSRSQPNLAPSRCRIRPMSQACEMAGCSRERTRSACTNGPTERFDWGVVRSPQPQRPTTSDPHQLRRDEGGPLRGMPRSPLRVERAPGWPSARAAPRRRDEELAAARNRCAQASRGTSAARSDARPPVHVQHAARCTAHDLNQTRASASAALLRKRQLQHMHSPSCTGARATSSAAARIHV